MPNVVLTTISVNVGMALINISSPDANVEVTVAAFLESLVQLTANVGTVISAFGRIVLMVEVTVLVQP